jgi:hypothetical protein
MKVPVLGTKKVPLSINPESSLALWVLMTFALGRRMVVLTSIMTRWLWPIGQVPIASDQCCSPDMNEREKQYMFAKGGICFRNQLGCKSDESKESR